MMIAIENEMFKAEINPQGAELTHLYHKKAKFDYIWNGTDWPKHAPILFPAIGRSNQDSYLIDGKVYEMPQHGFVTDFLFETADKKQDSVTLRLVSNDEMKSMYPFDFVLEVSFELNAQGLKTTFIVENRDDANLSFALGSHPAFNVPIAGEGTFEDYQITVNPLTEEMQKFGIIKTPAPYRDGNVQKISAAQKNSLPLTHTTFDSGLMIIENTGLESVKLSSTKSLHSVELTLNDFSYLTLWTKEEAEAPYLCIEPFYGLPDQWGDLKELAQKEGNFHLGSRQQKIFSYQMILK